MAKARQALKRRTKSSGKFLGIDSLKDLFMIGYSVLGISLLSDKVVNVANLQGTSFIKPLIAGAMGYFMTPRRQRNIITILALLACLKNKIAIAPIIIREPMLVILPITKS